MAVKYEVTAVTGKYTDRDGNEKNRYAKLGVILQTKAGFMLKLETIPIGWDGFAYLNEPREREQTNKPAAAGPSPRMADLESDVPF